MSYVERVCGGVPDVEPETKVRKTANKPGVFAHEPDGVEADLLGAIDRHADLVGRVRAT